MKISLCMIVKDEEKLLGGCLEAVAAHVDEMIVVDTGSADNTKAIAEARGAKLFDFEWVGDFSAARNFSIAQAANDWILVLDADEYIIGWDAESLEALEQSESALGRVLLENDFSENGMKDVSHISRVFNKRYYQYQGRIHEQLSNIDEEPFAFVDLDGIRVLHYGYNPQIMADKDKTRRNSELLAQALAGNPDDPYLLYQMGKAWYYRKTDLDKAVHYFGRASEVIEDYRLEYVVDLFICYGYALMNSGRLEQALGMEQFRQYYANNSKYMFMLAHAYMNNAMFDKAIAAFKQCATGRQGDASLAMLANYNIGVIYECMNNAKNAIKFYTRAKAYQPAQQRLGVLRGTA